MKKRIYPSIIFSFLSLAAINCPAQDDGKAIYSLGPGLAWQKSIYRGMDDRILPIPAFSIRAAKFSFNGISASYQVYSLSYFKYSVGLSFRLSGFNPDDSDYLKGMRERKFQLNFSNSGEYFLGPYYAGLRLSFNINDFSDGTEAEVFAGRRFRFRTFMIGTRLKAVYESPERTMLNYGVYRSEVLPGRSYYRPGAAISPGAEFSIIKNYGRNSLFIFFSLKELNKKIKASPIVDSKHDISLFAGYSFPL